MDNAPLYNTFVGIDIAKDKFDIAIRMPKGQFKHKIFANNEQGFNATYQWLTKHNGKSLITMEATNVYYEDLADFLYSKDLPIAVINPKTMPNFAKCLNLRNKTDKSDARMLAEYARIQADDIRLYQPKPENQRALLRQVRHLKRLNNMIIKTKLHLQTEKDEVCIELSQNIIAHIEKQIKLLENSIKSIIKNDEAMKCNAKLLQTIPAVGEKTVWVLLSHLGDCSQFKNAKEVVSFFGLTPVVRQSGSSLHTTVGISKAGHSNVRAALYAPAMNFACGRFKNREYAPFVNRLFAKGKPPKVVIVALMRKILTIAFAVLKNQTQFDATKLNLRVA